MFLGHIGCSFDNHAETFLSEVLFFLPEKLDVKVDVLTSLPKSLGQKARIFLAECI